MEDKMRYYGVGLYVKNSIEAVEMYKEAFSLELGYHMLNPDGTYFHSELLSGGKEMFSVVESSESKCTANPVQIGVTFDDKAQLLNAFDILSNNGNVMMEVGELPWSPCAAEVIDKFGIRWYLTIPQNRPPETFKAEDYINK